MMQGVGRLLLRSAPVAVLCALVTSAGGLSAAGPMPAVAAVTGGPVSPNPDTGTPALAPNGTTEQVRQIVTCNNVMYAVGSFTEISQGGQTYTRNNIFSFSEAPPFQITSWAPDVNGTINSIQLTRDCAHAFIGGKFSAVDGAKAENIAYIRTSNGTIVSSWPHYANKPVNTILLTANGHLLVGGLFTSINGSSNRYYVSLNPATGTDDGYLRLNIRGHYTYTGAHTNNTQVYNQQASPDGTHVLAEGTFTTVEANPRQQIFMLNLGSTHGNVSNWYSSEFNAYCDNQHPFYIKAAGWSPDQSTVYIATTGGHPHNWSQFPLTGLCDVVAAFPASRVGGLAHDWINYTGCNSLFSVAADGSAVYVGGHEQWADNPDGCKNAGPGAIPAPGMGGFTPGATGGQLLTNAAGTAGLYSRGRGLGADDMLLTPFGLWVASDNLSGTDTCGDASGLAGICFLPYP